MKDSTARLLRAAVPKPPRCLGLRLKPYSLGHDLLLSALGNGFLEGSPNFNDLFIGVFICAQDWREWERWEDSRWLSLTLRIWRLFIRAKEIPSAFATFDAYLRSGRDCPDINIPISKSSQAGTFGTPWQQRLKIFLVSKLGLTEEEAMSRPLALSNWDWSCYGEMDGTLELFSEKDEALFEFHRNRLANLEDN